LRNHKKDQYEISINASREGMEGEPSWVIDHTLRRKREELAERWEAREAKLARIRAEEQSMEGRGNKRRKIGAGASKVKDGVTDEEAAFLLNDWNDPDSNVADDDPTSLFSKETRALMEKIGLGPATKEIDEDDPEEELKVSLLLSAITSPSP